jgi:hypothetical protein
MVIRHSGTALARERNDAGEAQQSRSLQAAAGPGGYSHWRTIRTFKVWRSVHQLPAP